MRSFVVKLCFVSICALSTLLTGCKKEEILAPPFQEDYWELVNNTKDVIRDIKTCKNGYLFAITPDRILRSTDNGKTWETVLMYWFK